MAYTKRDLDRIIELFEGIEAGKAHEYAAPTYKDSTALREIAQITLSQTENSVEVLEEKIPALWYLTDCYDKMCRTGMSLKFYQLLLETHVALFELKKYSEDEMNQFESAFYSALKARNKYEDDDCEDLLDLVEDCLDEGKVRDLYDSVMERRCGRIKNDPVELTEEYLAVIDEVEEKIEKNKTMDFCLEYWSLKAEYLLEYDILWQSPTMLNPGVLFD